MKQVGVRELRQNLSVYLRRIGRGETLEVTERGRPVAVLSPLPERLSARERLVSAGKLLPATRAAGALGVPVTARTRHSISDALREERAER